MHASVAPDQPVDQPPGPPVGRPPTVEPGLDPAGTSRHRTPVRRWFGLWDAYFGLSYLVTTGLLLTSGDAPGRVAGAVAALTLAVPWYAGFGRPLLLNGGGRPVRARWFAAGLGALFGAATLLDVASSFALFAICPMLLMSLPSGPGIAVVLLANLVPPILLWVTSGEFGQAVLGVLPLTLLGIALAVLVGLWITRVAEQSRERAQLIEELELSRVQVARLSRQAGIAAERERLAREIHDTVAQGLTSLIALIETVDSELADDPELARRHLALAARVAADNLTETRGFVAALTPVPLRGNSLGEAVRRQGEALAAETDLTVDHTAEGTEFPLPTAVSVVLLRAAQEALANVRKHARAQRVSLRVEFSDAAVRLRVEDDGCGLAEPSPGPDGEPSGYGLRGMRGRVGEVGGTVEVTGAPGRGTVVEVVVPLVAATARNVEESR
ncbi:sensor histidine kinase [Streptacidiphilus melanogenes]|uniref:sensor histidine kinase n=1 Tax=Streptacidiphilus melanogenes TaxID=411235 RepID=UPI000693A8D1|nr:sensor histidine kinase [Streptacidiphilus melanogenes]